MNMAAVYMLAQSAASGFWVIYLHTCEGSVFSIEAIVNSRLNLGSPVISPLCSHFHGTLNGNFASICSFK